MERVEGLSLEEHCSEIMASLPVGSSSFVAFPPCYPTKERWCPSGVYPSCLKSFKTQRTVEIKALNRLPGHVWDSLRGWHGPVVKTSLRNFTMARGKKNVMKLRIWKAVALTWKNTKQLMGQTNIWNALKQKHKKHATAFAIYTPTSMEKKWTWMPC